jgi:Protein of unknown function (DUF3300)
MSPTSKISAMTLALLAFALPAAQQVGDPSSSAAQAQFTQAQLEQLVAPIALHPDGLLTQILTASTYPLEVVQAQRWVDQNSALKGAALEDALKPQDWDPSVKALCGFPTVLKQMSDNLDWTRDLGDAFLGQKTQLMDTVQRMRKKALDAGTLKSTPQQKVVQSEGTIAIEPVSAEVVYVPAYSPLVVYGPGWYYPYWYYPYWYYPPPYGGGYVTFGIGFWWGSACWSHCDWHQHTVFVDSVGFQTFTTRTSSRPVGSVFSNLGGGGPSGQFEWTHDPAHRKGVSYRSPQVGSLYGAAPGASRVPHNGPQGFDRSGKGTRPAPADPRGRPDHGRPAPPPPRPRPHERRRPDGVDIRERRSRG